MLILHFRMIQLYVNSAFQNATATVTVNIMDINDNDPEFVNTPYVFNVTEEQPGNTFVGLISVCCMEWVFLVYLNMLLNAKIILVETLALCKIVLSTF